MTKCVWFYHDGGKACETCACPGQVAIREAQARLHCAPGRTRHNWYGTRCLYCPATRYSDDSYVRAS